MRKPPSPCTRCGRPSIGNGRCVKHNNQVDAQRPSSKDRGYASAGHRKFQTDVLSAAQHRCSCGAVATVADHYPHSRKELIAMGENPDDPRHGRALCATCHNRHTATTQSGWSQHRPNY